MSEDQTGRQLTAREVLRTTPARRLLASSLLFYVGVMLQAATLGKHIYDITGREMDIGLLGLAEFLPIAAFVLVTGSVADRFNRRVVAIIALIGELICAIALMLYSLTDPTSVWPFFVIGFLFGTSRAFLSPAIRPMYPMVAPEGGLPSLIAMSSAVWTSAMIFGPAVSGFLYTIHPSMSYGATATMVSIGIFSLLRVHFLHPSAPRDPNEKVSLRSAMEGLHFIRRTPILLAAISLDLFAVLFGGAVALLPVIAEERLGVGDVSYGWLRAAGGIGAALMAIFLAARPLRRHVGRSLLIAVAIFGVGTIVLGTTRTYWIAFIAVLVLSGADMVSVFVRASIVPLVTPDSKRGRVSAVENVFIGATNELGAFESGVVSQLVGVPATVVGGGVATLGVVGLWWKLFPSLRKIDRFSDLEAPENPPR